MGKPLEVAIFTAAGEVRQEWTEEEVANLPAMAGVVVPTAGRPKLAAALLFHIQQQMEAAHTFFTIVDKEQRGWTFHAAQVFGVRVLEPLSGDVSHIGFRPATPAR